MVLVEAIRHDDCSYVPMVEMNDVTLRVGMRDSVPVLRRPCEKPFVPVPEITQPRIVSDLVVNNALGIMAFDNLSCESHDLIMPGAGR